MLSPNVPMRYIRKGKVYNLTLIEQKSSGSNLGTRLDVKCKIGKMFGVIKMLTRI